MQSSKTFDTRGVLTTPASDVHERLKTNGTAIKIAKETTNNQKHKFSGTNQKPERQRSLGTGLVRHCPQGLFSPFFTFLRAIYFSARLDFSSSPLSAPGSPRMLRIWNCRPFSILKTLTGYRPYSHSVFEIRGST